VPLEAPEAFAAAIQDALDAGKTRDARLA